MWNLVRGEIINIYVWCIWIVVCSLRSSSMTVVKNCELYYIHIAHTICTWVHEKAKCSRYRPDVVQRVGRGIALLFHDRGTSWGEWSAARPGRTLPPGKTRYQFSRRLGGHQGRSRMAGNLVPTGIRFRKAQRLVSHYTGWGAGPTLVYT